MLYSGDGVRAVPLHRHKRAVRGDPMQSIAAPFYRTFAYVDTCVLAETGLEHRLLRLRFPEGHAAIHSHPAHWFGLLADKRLLKRQGEEGNCVRAGAASYRQRRDGRAGGDRSWVAALADLEGHIASRGYRLLLRRPLSYSVVYTPLAAGGGDRREDVY